MVYLVFENKKSPKDGRRLVMGPYICAAVFADRVMTAGDRKPTEVAIRTPEGWVAHDGLGEASEVWDYFIVSPEHPDKLGGLG
jgi:hypothetical protein